MTAGSMGAGLVAVQGVIRAMGEQFARHIRERDIEGLVRQYYSETARVLPPNHAMIEGREAIGRFFDGLVRGGVADLNLEPVHIGASGDMAYEVGRYTMTLEPAGGEPVKDSGKYVVVFERQEDSSWKAVADCFNSDLAAA